LINALKLHPIFTSPLNTLTLAMCLCAGLGGGATLIAFSYLPGYGLVLAAGGVAAFAWSVWALVRTYSTIELAVKVLEGGAVGNLEQRLVHIGRGRDTLSRLCRATNNVLDAADSFARESNASLKEVTAGRFHRRILADGMHRAYKHSATTINQMTENLGIRIRENSALAAKFRESVNARVTEGAAITQATRSDAETMQMATHDALTQSAEVFEVAQATLREVEAVAQSTEELSLALDDVRSQVNRAALIAEDAEREVEAAQGVFTALADTARHIEKVTAIINKISAQTNLLALNATIEAGRAGEAGKGFSVVANEVKNLANQTAKATGDIRGQVASIQESALRAVDTMSTIGKTVREISQITHQVDDTVARQSASTQTIARTSSHVRRSVEHAATSVEKVTVSSQQSAEVAERLFKRAAAGAENAVQLTSEVGDFMSRVNLVSA
jgi:methyl-accepting chemotaxis protein